MSCPVDDLEALARGELGERAAAIEAHAADCADCRRELGWLRAERRLAGEQPSHAASEADWADLRRRIGEPVAPSRRRWIGAATLAVAAAVLAVALRARGGDAVVSGRHQSARRETIALGARGLAVAEAGSDLSYTVNGGSAAIAQTAGDVFYRVEAGGPFVVDTPLGVVEVRGTCFRVEVEDMNASKKVALGAAAGALAGAALVVTVYEGRVEVRSAAGEVALTAGHVARVEPGAAPVVLPDRAAAGTASAAADTPAALAAREQAQQAKIATLEARVRELEQGGERKSFRPARAFEKSKDELIEMARRCDLPMDLPPISGGTFDRVLEHAYAEAGFSEEERAIVARLMKDEQPAFEAALRTLYGEMAGDPAAGESLDALALILELTQKAPAEDMAEARKVLSAERAGLRRPPAELADRPVVERAFRVIIGSAERAAERMTAELPAARVRAFRQNLGILGFGDGCPEGGR